MEKGKTSRPLFAFLGDPDEAQASTGEPRATQG